MSEFSTKKCPECNAEVAGNTNFCPTCGYPFNSQNETDNRKNTNSTSSSKIAGKVKCWIAYGLAIICLIVGISRITCDDYKFYKKHYETCIAGYNENSRTSIMYGSGLFGAGYSGIASVYKDMAEIDLKEIWKYRIVAIVCCSGAVALTVYGYSSEKKEKANNGNNLLS